ncbi:expressed unknown protein [Seminavis robusta]|uniref:Uncharacterized protein n=1 Tax=Seminavis robusta TaxID=568900 RepID=A0A9N8DJ89_9STRA|nr:expressed unknown protein [Seminavis robusta]|eukprot:Sro172_g075910.1 n/a (276) ;mRNA; f:16812-17999
MNTDNSSDDLELVKIVHQRIAAAASEEHISNSRERERHLGGNRQRQHPRENLTALGPHTGISDAKSSHENDGKFDLMEIVAQRAADARTAIDSEQAQEQGFPKSSNQALGAQEHDNIPSSSIGMTSLRRMRNVIAEFVQPGAYPVDGTAAPLQEEDGSSGSDNEGEKWEEENIQAVAYPIDHQGTEELLPSGVPFIARNRTAWKRKLLCYVSLQMFVGMLIVTTFLVVFVVRAAYTNYIQCDDSGHMKGLSFIGNKLDGTIPPELSLLSSDLEIL